MRRAVLALALAWTAVPVLADEPVPSAVGDMMPLEGWWDLRFWRGSDSAGPAQEPPLPAPGAVWGAYRWPNFWWAWTMTAPELNGSTRRLPPEYKLDGDLLDQSGCWLRRHFTLPQAWLKKSVTLRFPELMFCDAVVYVNGRRAGVVLRPAGEIDITAYLKGKGVEEIVYFITRQSEGITRHGDYLGKPRGDDAKRFLVPTGGCPVLYARDPSHFREFYCDTSWRKKSLTLVTEFVSAKAGRALFKAQIVDQGGKVVKTGEQAFDVKEGPNPVSMVIPWENPVTWEIGRGYLYFCKVTVTMGGGVVTQKSQRFGFREIWREGKEIMMNGHVQRLRTVYSFGAKHWGADFLCGIGYNCIHFSHGKETTPIRNIDPDFLDEQGIACICAGPQLVYGVQPKFVRNEAYREDYRRIMRETTREHRNHPSIIGMYLGVNAPFPVMPNWMMWPNSFGMFERGEGDVSATAMNMACGIGHETNPNILFYGHADGNDGDIASMNIYPNFMPWQERDEWIAPWAEKGVLPIQAAEFGEVYWLCWHTGETFSGFKGTEYTAIEFGDESYDMETDDDIIALRTRIVGWGGNILQVPHESVWRYREELVRRNHRMWRAYGFNGGLVWFNLSGYGKPDGHSISGLQGKVEKRPDWVNRDYDIFRQGNLDFLSFIGGSPEHTDKTHAYYSGETIRKQAVLVWDGFGEKDVRGECGLFSGVGPVAALEKKPFAEKLAQGDIRKVELSFTAPEVGEKTVCELRMSVTCPGFARQDDVFRVEIYPRRIAKLKKSIPISLYDPVGDTAKALDLFGFKYTKLATLDRLNHVKNLVVGRLALADGDWAKSCVRQIERDLPRGANVLVMAQYPSAWQAFGLSPEDTSSRRLFPRGGGFARLTPDALSYWRGTPAYGSKTECGHLMKHKTARGPRGGYKHTVAGFVLQIPDVPGYLPVVDGEFDMNYAGVLRRVDTDRTWVFSTLDVEGRAGVDPAATEALKALMRDFLMGATAKAGGGVRNRRIVVDGASAQRLAKDLPSSGKGERLLLVGPDAKIGWSELSAAVQSGANALVYANPRLMKKAGFSVSPARKVYRYKGLSGAAFAGIGPSLLRARDYQCVETLGSPPKGWSVSKDGVFAEAVLGVGKGHVVYCALDPYQIADRYLDANPSPVAVLDANDDPSKMSAKHRARQRVETGLSGERMRALFARLLTNLGAPAPASGTGLYTPWDEKFDPYVYKYW